MIKRMFSYFDSLDRLAILAVSFVLLLLFGVLDYLGGEGLASSVFYLIPVAAVGWKFDVRISGPFALLATLVWVTVMLLLGAEHSNVLIATWDGVSRFVIYFAFAVLLGHVRTSLEQAREHALTDYLTGLANARYFHELAKRELEHCLRHQRPFTLAYIDVDDFKRVNDHLGHSGGDRVLKAVATALSGNVRGVDQVARLGGDEFMLFLHEVDPEIAGSVLQHISKRVTSSLERSGHSITLSIGGVTWGVPPATLDAAIHAADQVMYQAKQMDKGTVLHRTIEDERPQKRTVDQRSGAPVAPYADTHHA